MMGLSRKERDKQLRKSDILKAAERIFASKGFFKATMHDIAQEAQYATGTVYLYFKDKDSLYFSLLDEKIKGFLAEVRKDTEDLIDAEAKIKIFINKKLDYFERNKDFFGIFLSERSKVRAVRERKFSRSSVLLQHREFVADLIKSAQEQNLIRKDYNAMQVGEIFISILMSVVFDWFKNEDSESNVSLVSLSDFVFDIFIKGVGEKK